MYCKYCGHEVEKDSRFCLSCGKMIAEEVNDNENCENNNFVVTAEALSFEEKVEENKDLSSKNKLEPFYKISKLSYCTNCGTTMGNGKICPNCNYKKNNGIHKFCSFCGASVEEDKCSNSKVAIKTSFIEKFLRFISLFLIYFSLVDVFVHIFDGNFLSAFIIAAISSSCKIFLLSKRQIYKLKAFLISKNIKQLWICLVYILTIILVIVGISATSSKTENLSGDDLAAYNLISEVSYEFKNPSSVRLISGEVFYDDENAEWCGWFAISATNGFGARTVGYYFVGYLDGEIFALDLEEYGSSSSIRNAKTKDELNIEKINSALDKKWGTSFND